MEIPAYPRACAISMCRGGGFRDRKRRIAAGRFSAGVRYRIQSSRYRSLHCRGRGYGRRAFPAGVKPLGCLVPVLPLQAVPQLGEVVDMQFGTVSSGKYLHLCSEATGRKPEFSAGEGVGDIPDIEFSGCVIHISVPVLSLAHE